MSAEGQRLIGMVKAHIDKHGQGFEPSMDWIMEHIGHLSMPEINARCCSRKVLDELVGWLQANGWPKSRLWRGYLRVSR